jgi:hypothetical protein
MDNFEALEADFAAPFFKIGGRFASAPSPSRSRNFIATSASRNLRRREDAD